MSKFSRLISCVLFMTLVFIVNLICTKELDASFTNSYLDELFPPFIVYGQLIEEYEDVKKDEVVEIIGSNDRKYFLVDNGKGERIILPWNLVKILPISEKNIQECSNKQIEEYANTRLKSYTNHIIWTDLWRLKTYVLEYINSRWTLVKVMSCSSGDLNHPTQRGTFHVKYKNMYIGKQDYYLCKYIIAFYEDYMYHTVLFDWNGTKIIDGRLGKRVSFGCIRHSVEDSMWLYNNISVYTAVYVN